jgi:hypothetical protein
VAQVARFEILDRPLGLTASNSKFFRQVTIYRPHHHRYLKSLLLSRYSYHTSTPSSAHRSRDPWTACCFNHKKKKRLLISELLSSFLVLVVASADTHMGGLRNTREFCTFHIPFATVGLFSFYVKTRRNENFWGIYILIAMPVKDHLASLSIFGPPPRFIGGTGLGCRASLGGFGHSCFLNNQCGTCVGSRPSD